MRLLSNRHLSVLVILVLLSGCFSAPLTEEERLERRVLFTISGDSSDYSLVNTYASETYLGLTRKQESVQPVVSQLMSMHRLKRISQWPIKALGLEAIVAEIRGDRSVEEVVQALARDQRVESVQAVVTYDLLSYNDPYFHMQNATIRVEDIEQIHALATGKDVVVALIDTGVDRQHPELVDRIVFAENFVEHDRRFDTDEHGTTVAGVIASTANNDLGIVGVAPEVKLMVFKSCWEDSQTRRAKCDSYSISKALAEVVSQRPDVLNLSLAGPPDELIRRLLALAIQRGIIVVAAFDPGRRSFPASMRDVIAVGAPLSGDVSMPTNGLLAPGTDILTTAPGATYAFRSGSSMSTAYVSGIAALMRERQPMLSATEVRSQLRATSRYSVNMVPVVDICNAVIGADLCATGAIAINPVPSEHSHPDRSGGISGH